MIPKDGTLMNTMKHLLATDGGITDKAASCLFNGTPNEQRGYFENYPGDAVNLYKWVFRKSALFEEPVTPLPPTDGPKHVDILHVGAPPEEFKEGPTTPTITQKEDGQSLGLSELKEAKSIGEKKKQSLDEALSAEEK